MMKLKPVLEEKKEEIVKIFLNKHFFKYCQEKMNV